MTGDSGRVISLLHPHMVCLSSLDLLADCFTVANATDNPVPMSGWTVQSETYDSSHGWTGTQTFTFPEGYSLEASGTLTVWSGRVTDRDQDVYGRFRGRVRKGAAASPHGVWVNHEEADAEAEAEEGLQGHCFWTGRFIWNNAGDTAGLYDADGVLQDRLIATAASSMKLRRRDEPDDGIDDDNHGDGEYRVVRPPLAL